MWSVTAPRRAQTRPDPAPSRLAYRYERMMLRRGARRVLSIGLPVLALALAAGAWLSSEGNRATLAASWAAARDRIESHPQFMVSAMAIDGADDALQSQIRTVLPVEFPVSSFDLDLGAMRETVVGLAPVKKAAIRRETDGILRISVVQRRPVLVWRGPEGLVLVDADGVQLGPLETRALRADLPLIAGEGATAHIAEALDLIAAVAPLADRLRGLQRRGERRWDVVLDRDQVLMLPEDDPVRALERIIALASAGDLLARDIAAVDLRVPHRPTLRLNDAAAEALRAARLQLAGADEQ